MKIEFVSSVALITPDPAQSRRLYVDALGLPLTSQSDDGYLHSEQVPGTKHLGVWPLSRAAASDSTGAVGPDGRPAALAGGAILGISYLPSMH